MSIGYGHTIGGCLVPEQSVPSTLACVGNMAKVKMTQMPVAHIHRQILHPLHALA